MLAIKHLGLRPFLREDFKPALEFATQAAFGTDEGVAIMRGLLAGLAEAKLVHPCTATLERIGLAGRARAQRLAAQMAEINIVLTDASIAMFERLTGQLFTRSKRKQDQTLQASQPQIGRLTAYQRARLHRKTEPARCGANAFCCKTLEILDIQR